MADYILVEKTQGVAIITMNRPAQLNAMSRQLSEELHDAVTQMSADDEVGCIVVTGAGDRAFSAGGDIHEQREDDRTQTQEELDARGAALHDVTLESSYPSLEEAWAAGDQALTLPLPPAALELFSSGRVLARFLGSRDAVNRMVAELEKLVARDPHLFPERPGTLLHLLGGE